MQSNAAAAAPAALALAALGAACMDRPEGWDHQRAATGPIPLEDRVAYVDGAGERVVVVAADPESPEIETYDIGHDPAFAAPAPDGRHLAVITWGGEALPPDGRDEEPALWYFDATDPEAEPAAYPLGSHFDRIAIRAGRDDGDAVAVAYRSADPDLPRGVFVNPNEIAVVDLDSPPGEDNPARQSVRSFGSAPEGVILSPPMEIAGTGGPARTLAFVLSENAIALVDTSHPTRPDIALELSGTGDEVVPREIAFEPDAGVAYVRSDGARDVLEIELEAKAGASEGENDYRPGLAELGAGGGPADIAVYDGEDGRRYILAAMPSARAIALIDAATGAFRRVETPDPIDRVLLFPRGDDATPRTALLASVSADVERAHLLDLEEVGDDLAPVRLTPVPLDQPVADVAAAPGRELALLMHDDARTILGLLDVGTGTVTPIHGAEPLERYAFAAGGTHLVSAAPASTSVGFLDLDTLHPSDTRLDAPPERALAMEGGAIFVDHGDRFGMATILPEAGAGRDEARVLSGFLLKGALDRDL